MSTFAFFFPGQGSQHLGMLHEAYAQSPIIQRTFTEANDTLGIDLWAICQSNEEKLNQTEYTQPILLTASVALWRQWIDDDKPRPDVMAGHSLGEYSALVCAGAMAFADAVKVTAKRGQLMQQAVPVGVGAMSAIIGLDDARVIELCEEAAKGRVVSAANFNSPGQVVIAGDAAAVTDANALMLEAGAKRALTLPVSVPSHCALMKPAAEALAIVLATIDIQAPTIEVIHNADVHSYQHADEIRAALVRQLYSPVRWVETIEKITQQGVKSGIECGPGKVLMGLNRRIDKTLVTTSI